MKGKSWATYIVLLFCVIAWGSNFVFGSILVQHFDPSIIAFMRLIFILLFLFGVTYSHVKKSKVSVKSFILLAVAGFIGVSLNQWSFYASLEYTDPITAALILALSPIVTALLSTYYFKERRRWPFWLGAIIGLSGVWLVITQGSWFVPLIGKGELLIGVTMLTFSVFLLFVQQLSKTLHPAVITWYSNVFGFIGLVPFVPWKTLPSVVNVNWEYWILLILTAIIMHGICTYLWNSSIQKVGAASAVLLLNLEPFVAMIVSFLVLKHMVSSPQILGGFVIIIGIALSLNSKVRSSSY